MGISTASLQSFSDFFPMTRTCSRTSRGICIMSKESPAKMVPKAESSIDHAFHSRSSKTPIPTLAKNAAKSLDMAYPDASGYGGYTVKPKSCVYCKLFHCGLYVSFTSTLLPCKMVPKINARRWNRSTTVITSRTRPTWPRTRYWKTSSFADGEVEVEMQS